MMSASAPPKSSGSAGRSGLFGTVDGSFFRAPPWVDTNSAPGTTAQTPPAWLTWAKNIAKGGALFYSPNLVWLSMALFVYVCFPYDYVAARTLESGWVFRRLLINLVVCGGYYGFWEVSLYSWGWASRKFRGGYVGEKWHNASWPTQTRLLHNFFYWTLGVAQATGWEVACIHLMATGKLPCIHDAQVLGSAADAARTLAWVLLIPVWRAFHFYFAHRFIHVRPVYKLVHSLHHRNVDIEPFAGLSMHPVEHLYYFSCLAPSLWLRMSPFQMTWNLWHLLASPAASHSGWEDHMQSDQFHYLHHRKFECNYGSASFPLDNLFGTFRERLGDSSTYRGGGGDAGGGGGRDGGKDGGKGAHEEKAAAALPPPFEGLAGSPPPGFWLFMAFTALLLGLLLREVACGAHHLPHASAAAGTAAGWCKGGSRIGGRTLAALVAFGPVAGCVLLHYLLGDRQPLRWPFHREAKPQLSFHLLVGLLVGVLPVYHLLAPLLEPDATAALRGSAYCALHRCGASVALLKGEL